MNKQLLLFIFIITNSSLCYLFLEMTTDCSLNTKIYDKRDDLNFPIVYLLSNLDIYLL